jgi:Zn-dependent protease with chaperone function
MLGAAAAVGAGIESVQRTSTGVGRVRLAGVILSYPTVNRAEWLLLGLAAVGASALTVACRAAWRQRSTYHEFLDRLEVVGQLEAHPTLKVLAGSRPEAFCAGYLRPTIYLSQGAVELLTAPELEAVLAHEHHHKRVHDPLRFALGAIFREALFFAPVMRSLHDRYADLAELNADRAAIGACRKRRSQLASALLAFETSASPGASGISPERVDALLGQPTRWRLPVPLVASSLGLLSALILLSWQAGRVASVRATFNLPLLSSQPCAGMTLWLLLGCIAAVRCRNRGQDMNLADD